jgi:hypothetical protein
LLRDDFFDDFFAAANSVLTIRKQTSVMDRQVNRNSLFIESP